VTLVALSDCALAELADKQIAIAAATASFTKVRLVFFAMRTSLLLTGRDGSSSLGCSSRSDMSALDQ
jgi:hypothetical protein